MPIRSPALCWNSPFLRQSHLFRAIVYAVAFYLFMNLIASEKGKPMSTVSLNSRKMAARAGFWSALVMAVIFVLFPVCYVAILQVAGVFVWTDIAAYAAVADGPAAFYRHAAQAMILLFVLVYVVLVNAIHELTPENGRFLTRLSLLFGLGFAVLSGVHYFLQLSIVRLNLGDGTLDGLQHVVQANPYSAVAGVNMLGVGLFFGLSSLCLAPVFRGGRLETVIRFALYANAASCLLGGLAFALDWVVIVFLTVNLGMGAAVLVAAIALMRWFRRQDLVS